MSEVVTFNLFGGGRQALRARDIKEVYQHGDKKKTTYVRVTDDLEGSEVTDSFEDLVGAWRKGLGE